MENTAPSASDSHSQVSVSLEEGQNLLCALQLAHNPPYSTSSAVKTLSQMIIGQIDCSWIDVIYMQMCRAFIWLYFHCFLRICLNIRQWRNSNILDWQFFEKKNLAGNICNVLFRCCTCRFKVQPVHQERLTLDLVDVIFCFIPRHLHFLSSSVKGVAGKHGRSAYPVFITCKI